MTELPDGWTSATLHDIGIDLRPGFASGKHNRDGRGVPHLRPMNITRTGELILTDLRFVADDTDRRVLTGDILFNNTNSAALVGKTAYVTTAEPLAFSNHMTRMRCPESINSKYVAFQLQWLQEAGYFQSVLSHHVNQASVSTRVLGQTQIRVPPSGEQRRIVAALEDHLSRLDAAVDNLNASLSRLAHLAKRVIVDAVPIPSPSHWQIVPVKDAGSVELGRQRHPDWHNGPHMRPYLRVANVFEDRIDTTSLMEMNFPPDVFERFKLNAGDILLNEGQSPIYLGRPAMYRGTPKDAAFTNSLIRFKAGPRVSPEWALLVFRRHMHAGRFIREVRITTNIAHLSASRLKSVEFPIPPLEEQDAIVAATRARLAAIDRLSEGLESALTRASHLRAALLREAFAGRLVPQDPSDEPASVLLARIRAERETAAPRKRAPRPRRKPPSHSDTTTSGFVQETLL